MLKKTVVLLLGGLLVSALMVAPALAAYKIGAVFSVTGGASFLGDPEKKNG